MKNIYVIVILVLALMACTDGSNGPVKSKPINLDTNINTQNYVREQNTQQNPTWQNSVGQTMYQDESGNVYVQYDGVWVKQNPVQAGDYHLGSESKQYFDDLCAKTDCGPQKQNVLNDGTGKQYGFNNHNPGESQYKLEIKEGNQ